MQGVLLQGGEGAGRGGEVTRDLTVGRVGERPRMDLRSWWQVLAGPLGSH